MNATTERTSGGDAGFASIDDRNPFRSDRLPHQAYERRLCIAEKTRQDGEPGAAPGRDQFGVSAPSLATAQYFSGIQRRSFMGAASSYAFLSERPGSSIFGRSIAS
jgi:hypothetical protein